MRPITTKLTAFYVTSSWANAAFAHPGHHMEGSHWHATDAWGFAALGVMVALAIWLTRGGK